MHLKHLIPFAFLSILIIISLFSDPDNTSLDFNNVQQSTSNLLLVKIISFMLYGHIGIYLWLSKSKLNAYKRTIKEQFSNLKKANLNWLNFMISSFFLVGLFGILQSFFLLNNNKNLAAISLLLFIILLFYFINSVLFKALKRPELFAGVSSLSSGKYADSQIPDVDLLTYKFILEKSMEKEQLYLNPDLNIDDLATHLNIPEKKLSQVINQIFHKNFFNFINSYRIEEAKKLLTNTQNKKLTIQEIMYTVGFSSKSSFNTIFKKQTQLTPSEFKKKFHK